MGGFEFLYLFSHSTVILRNKISDYARKYITIVGTFSTKTRLFLSFRIHLLFWPISIMAPIRRMGCCVLLPQWVKKFPNYYIYEFNFLENCTFFVNSIPVNFKRIQKQVLPGGWVFKMLFWRKKNSWENHFIRKITTVELTDKMWLFFLFSVLLVVNADPLIQNDQPDLNIKNINDIGPNKVIKINLFFFRKNVLTILVSRKILIL